MDFIQNFLPSVNVKEFKKISKHWSLTTRTEVEWIYQHVYLIPRTR